MNRYVIAQIIALVATALSVIGFILVYKGINDSLGGTLVLVGFAVGIVSYLFGGLLTAIKMSAGIAKWGWFLVPFPLDILTFFVCLIVAFIVFIFIPIIPVRIAYKNNM